MVNKKIKNFGIDLADKITSFVGSWKFIILQSVILIAWMIININNMVEFDPYPFILMNLFLSAQAAYATPMILMSGNRQSEKDRRELLKDLRVDQDTNIVVSSMLEILKDIEEDIKLDKQAIKDHAEILSELKKLNNKKDE
jgi:uncharacterized membrane protein